MSETPWIVKEILVYSDGSEKVVNFNRIGESAPEEVIGLEEALAKDPEIEEEEVVEEEEVDEDEEVPESESEIELD